jgi:type IV pilus assembly protein PilA
MALLLVVGIGLIRRSGKFVRVGVALILVPVIVYVIVLLTIPATGSYRKHTNEISAIKSINDINQVQQQYKSSFPDKGYAPTLASLGGDPKSGPPTPAAAQMLKSDLAAGAKSGYIFVITDYNKVKINGTERITGYTFTAVPHIVGKTGNRGFCSDESGIIKVDPAGGENCSEPIQ